MGHFNNKGINKSFQHISDVLKMTQPSMLYCKTFVLPGYGTRPLVTSSVKKTPNDHTSDLMVNLPNIAASGAVHLMGNFAPGVGSHAGLALTCDGLVNMDTSNHVGSFILIRTFYTR